MAENPRKHGIKQGMLQSIRDWKFPTGKSFPKKSQGQQNVRAPIKAVSFPQSEEFLQSLLSAPSTSKRSKFRSKLDKTVYYAGSPFERIPEIEDLPPPPAEWLKKSEKSTHDGEMHKE